MFFPDPAEKPTPKRSGTVERRAYRGLPESLCQHTMALSGSFCAGIALVRAIPVPARPCKEASHAANEYS
jgi:hypothetical protein